MPKRERAYLGDKLVTIIERKGRGRNATVEIRDSFGFLREVKARDLTKPSADEPVASFSFGDED